MLATFHAQYIFAELMDFIPDRTIPNCTDYSKLIVLFLELDPKKPQAERKAISIEQARILYKDLGKLLATVEDNYATDQESGN